MASSRKPAAVATRNKTRTSYGSIEECAETATAAGEYYSSLYPAQLAVQHGELSDGPAPGAGLPVAQHTARFQASVLSVAPDTHVEYQHPTDTLPLGNGRTLDLTVRITNRVRLHTGGTLVLAPARVLDFDPADLRGSATDWPCACSGKASCTFCWRMLCCSARIAMLVAESCGCRVMAEVTRNGLHVHYRRAYAGAECPVRGVIDALAREQPARGRPPPALLGILAAVNAALVEEAGAPGEWPWCTPDQRAWIIGPDSPGPSVARLESAYALHRLLLRALPRPDGSISVRIRAPLTLSSSGAPPPRVSWPVGVPFADQRAPLLCDVMSDAGRAAHAAATQRWSEFLAPLP